MSEFLDVRRFVQMAQEEDLLVLFRPGETLIIVCCLNRFNKFFLSMSGPFICAEWEFGGLPRFDHDFEFANFIKIKHFLNESSVWIKQLHSCFACKN